MEVKAKKHLGQHFLADSHYAEKIADAIPAMPDERVLEIGPGTGALSIHLKERFPLLHMVELDEQIIPTLKRNLNGGSWTLHQANALEFDYAQAGFPLHVVGNLPYISGARIIHRILKYGNRIRSCTFMVQKEVAERIAAVPHGRTIGYLSIFCQFFGTPRVLFHVPPGAFVPPPTVISSVFQIQIHPHPEQLLPTELWDGFFSFVDTAFRMRRKVLPNALSPIMSKEKTTEALLESGMSAKVRPEDLDVKQWLMLFRRMHPL